MLFEPISHIASEYQYRAIGFTTSRQTIIVYPIKSDVSFLIAILYDILLWHPSQSISGLHCYLQDHARLRPTRNR